MYCDPRVFQNTNEGKIKKILMDFINEINGKIEVWIENGSDAGQEKLEKAYGNVSRYDQLVAGTYTPLPKHLQTKNNVQNKRDNECLKWALRAELFPTPEGKNPLRTTSHHLAMGSTLQE